MKRINHYQLGRKYKAKIIRDIYRLSAKDVDELLLKIPVLNRDDRLFVESKNVNNPRLIPDAKDNELYYEYGYINTTLMLLNNIEFCKSYFHKDCYLYPAMFCFRQYLENMMKVIILKYDDNGIIGLKHDLNKCWGKLLLFIEDVDEVVLSVGQIVHELQEIDGYATTFRYTGVLNNTFNQKSGCMPILIDVKELRNRVLQVYRFFDGLYELSCRIKNKRL